MTDFDQRAKDWDSDLKKVHRAQVIAEAIRGIIPPSTEMSALEYGCGTGLLSFALRDQFRRITLADTSQGMLDVLKEKLAASNLTHMTPLRLDLSVEPVPAERFAITYSLLTLHHIQDTKTVISKFHDLLLPNGLLLIADLDKEDGSFHTDGTTDVHLGFDRSELKKTVESAGFEQVIFSTAYIIRKNIADQEREFPVFLLSARKKA